MLEPRAKMSMAAAETSLAILMSGRYRVSIASVAASMAVLTDSITKPTVIKKIINNHSIFEILKIIPPKIEMIEKKK